MTHRVSSIAWLALFVSPALADVTLGPMVGKTDHSSARIWARGDGEGQLRVRYRVAGSETWQRSEPVPFAADADWTAQVELRALTPRTEYEYALEVDDAALDGRWRFRTLPPPGAGTLSLAFGSCVHLERFPEQPVFDAIRAARPDVFLIMGDTVYYTRQAAAQPEVGMWPMQRAQRGQPQLAALLATVPTLGQWDDHDYGPNDSDKTYEHKAYSRHVFTSYWANGVWGQDGEGTYGVHRLGPVDLFLLDDRYFRDPDRQRHDAPEKTILGQRQREWLVDGLARSQAPVKLVATATQFLADYQPFGETWNLALHERSWILEQLNARDVQGVIFLSGDRHMAEVLRYEGAGPGYDLWEVTSSPLANRMVKIKLPTERREFAETGGPNFGWVEVDAEAGTVRLELRDATGATLWSATPQLTLRKPKRFF